MFGLFTQVLDSISGCTDGESNPGLWVWLWCLFTSSWYNSYPKRQTGKLWSATLGLVLKCVKGLESPWAVPAFLDWVIFNCHGHFLHLLHRFISSTSQCSCWARGIGDVKFQGCILGSDSLTPSVLHVPTSSASIQRFFLICSVILFIRMEWRNGKGWGMDSCVLENHR